MEREVAIAVRVGARSDHRSLVQIDQYAISHFDRASAIADALASEGCFVAEAEAEPLGYVVLNYAFFGFGFIPLIVAASAHRRKGIGLRLLVEARARCTSRKLFTSANVSNKPAHALFTRAGFVRSGIIENLDKGDPEIVYFTQCGQP